MTNSRNFYFKPYITKLISLNPRPTLADHFAKEKLNQYKKQHENSSIIVLKWSSCY